MMELMVLLSMMLFFSKNPVKLSMTIMLTAMAMFVSMWSMSGKTWIPMILMLLFTGGILIVFMILSSFHPNEKTSKMKLPVFMTVITLMSLWLSEKSKTHAEIMNMETMKTWFQSMWSSYLLTIIILTYFMMFLKILKKEKNSMRMIMCQ